MLNWKVILAIFIVIAVSVLIFGGVSYIYMTYFAKYTPAVIVAEKFNASISGGQYTAFCGGKIYYYDSRNSDKGIYSINKDGGNPELVQKSDYTKGISVNSKNIFYFSPTAETIYKASRNPGGSIIQQRKLSEDNSMLPKYRIKSLFATESTLYTNEGGNLYAAPESNIAKAGEYAVSTLKNDGAALIYPVAETATNPNYTIFDSSTNQNVLSLADSRMIVSINGYVIYAAKNKLLTAKANEKPVQFKELPLGDYVYFHYINELEYYAVVSDYKTDITDKKQSNHISDSVVRINTTNSSVTELVKTRGRERIVAIVDNRAYVCKSGYLYAFDLVKQDYEPEYQYKLPDFSEKDTIVFEPCGDFIFVYNADFNELLCMAKVAYTRKK